MPEYILEGRVADVTTASHHPYCVLLVEVASAADPKVRAALGLLKGREVVITARRITASNERAGP